MKTVKKFLIINIITVLMSFSIYAEANLFDVAKNLFNKGLYFLARENFYNIINNSSNPNLIEKSYYYASLSSYYNKEYKTAMYEFSLLFLNFPNTQFKESAEFFSAKSAFFLNKYLIAVRKLKLFKKEYPASKFKKQSNLLIGKSLFFLGYYNKAVYYLSKTKNPESTFYIALSYIRQGMNQKALNYFAKINNTKYKQLAFYYIGYIYYKQNDFEKAKKYLTLINSKILTIYNKANFMLANIQFLDKDFKHAYHYIKKSNMNTPEYKFLLSEILIKLRKFDNALKILKDIKTKTYKNKANYNIGKILLKKGDYETALIYFKEVLNFNAEYNLTALSYFYIAKIYYEQNRIKEAHKYISKVSEKSIPVSELKNYFFIKGALFFYKKNYETAIINLKKYIKISGETSKGLYYLAVSYYKFHDYTNANKYFLSLFDKYTDYRIKIFDFIIELNIHNVNLIIKEFNEIFNKLTTDKKKSYSLKISKLLIENQTSNAAIKYLNYLNTVELNQEEKEKLNFLYVKYYLNTANFNEADKILTGLINNADNSDNLIKYYYTKYSILTKQNKPDEAKIWLKKILKMNTTKSNEYYKKAKELLNKK